MTKPAMLRPGPSMLLRMAEDPRLRKFFENRLHNRDLASRYVSGESVSSAVDVTGELLARGRSVSVALLASDPLDRSEARDRRKRLRKVLRRLGQAGLATADPSGAGRVEVCVRLGALGAGLSEGETVAIENALAVAESAAGVGARVTLESEPSVGVSLRLAAVDALRAQFPDTGVELVAGLPRTEADVAERIASGCRVRLSKGGEDTPDGLDRHKADLAYVRCLAALMRSDVPFSMTAEDRRILDIADTLVARGLRARGSFEYHLRFGDRPMVAAMVSDRGDTMRVYVPFGEDFYPYLMARIADQPSRVASLLRPSRNR
ncbi:MAG: hypothetical protein Q4G51_11880 [Dermatophilus congolensis]|nr:hypothetical protein [Dermatophilus congolensis]